MGFHSTNDIAIVSIPFFLYSLANTNLYSNRTGVHAIKRDFLKFFMQSIFTYKKC